MAGPLEGIRVIEVASWMFIPSGGSVLVDWGAEVLKVEHPETGDPQRGLITSGLLPGGPDGVNFMVEQPNRGKKSIGIDIGHPDGHEALMTLVETADVFVTNYLPPVRRKLGIDTDDIKARNPDIVIARGSGQGSQGPDAEKGGYDGASFWARGGVGSAMPTGKDGWPQGQPTPAFGDVMGGLTTAGAIAAALVQRERTGHAPVVDVSLLATAMWQISPMVVASRLFGFDRLPSSDRKLSPNPGVATYRTRDDRFISLILLQSDKHWAEFAQCLAAPDLVDDPRFADSTARAEHNTACIERLDELFGAHDLDHWKQVLADFSGVWTPFQTLGELYDDPQVIANGYLPTMTTGGGQDVQLVASPAQFDEAHITVQRAPEHGEHTEVVLAEAGIDWDRLAEMKASGAIL
ncbi:MAG: CoA transferase [Acidimicrobiia bacterium]|nr:CoA transferase [Acidimicrobiia bacterium]